MTNETALKKARALHPHTGRFTFAEACPYCTAIAAALMRAYADGMERAADGWYREVIASIRAEADSLERGQ